MKNKAQATSLSEMLVGLLTIGLIGMFVFFFITRGQSIQVKVEENEILRRKIILTNILLSSDKLAYSDDSTIHRGILDKEKLDNIQSDPYHLYSEISYPNTGYYIKVVDLDNKNEWKVGEDFNPSFQSPVAIRYLEDDVHVGLLSVDFAKEFTVTPGITTTTTQIIPSKTGIVKSENGQFMLDGKRYRFVGVNANSFDGLNTQEEFDDHIKYLANDCGVSVIRVFLTALGGDKVRMALESARKLKREEELDVKFIVVLGDSAIMTSRGCIDGFFNDANYPMDVYERNANATILEFKNQYAEQIFTWEILNEPGCGYCKNDLCCPGQTSCDKCDNDRQSCPSELENFLKIMSTKIRQNDPDHMVVVGLIGDTYGRHREPYVSQYKSWIEYMDAGQAHCYGTCTGGNPFDTLDITKNEMKKPFIFGEFGVSNYIGDKDIKIKDVMNKFFQSDGDGLLYWDYSTVIGNRGEFAFFKGEKDCRILKEWADQLKN